jgi:hypothetical protein
LALRGNQREAIRERLLQEHRQQLQTGGDSLTNVPRNAPREGSATSRVDRNRAPNNQRRSGEGVATDRTNGTVRDLNGADRRQRGNLETRTRAPSRQAVGGGATERSKVAAGQDRSGRPRPSTRIDSKRTPTGQAPRRISPESVTDVKPVDRATPSGDRVEVFRRQRPGEVIGGARANASDALGSSGSPARSSRTVERGIPINRGEGARGSSAVIRSTVPAGDRAVRASAIEGAPSRATARGIEGSGARSMGPRSTPRSEAIPGGRATRSFDSGAARLSAPTRSSSSAMGRSSGFSAPRSMPRAAPPAASSFRGSAGFGGTPRMQSGGGRASGGFGGGRSGGGFGGGRPGGSMGRGRN